MVHKWCVAMRNALSQTSDMEIPAQFRYPAISHISEILSETWLIIQIAPLSILVNI